ncbi:hypothetical protein BDA99DRAFT_342943 [Phascolomyces articulosus]|uniref:Transcription elongation factor Eaf N-terminal domain-containing protein n=1 Tax=Phascolomyces articulosus TaxID=60185 RepID=A0AAD5KFD8_9FUNG|nr:hypothetical protein BDA99DRAFT_342943 [Phascolomyces articulosus]
MLDPTMSSRKAQLEKTDNDSYTAEWGPLEDDNTQLNYDATPSQPQEVDCILLFDETTQTFTLQRPTLKFTMRKSRKRKTVIPQLPEPKASKTTSVPSKRPAKTVPAASSSSTTTTTTKPSKRIGSKTTPSAPPTTSSDVTEQRRSSVDDFAMDIESNMMDILEDDDDDDEEEENQGKKSMAAPTGTAASSDSDTFEEVVVHPQPQPQPQQQQQQQRPATDSPATTNKKRKFKMASQPIRRLDDSPSVATPPTATKTTPTPATASPAQHRPDHGGKSISSAAGFAYNRNRNMVAVQSSSDSSSGSSSSEDESGSSSSEDESGSSSSGSEEGSSGSDSDESDDDDMDDLAADISLSLSADTHSVPPSPNATAAAARSYNTPATVPERSPYSASPAARGTPNRNGGPMSLRALFNDGADQGEEDEGITSSDSGSDDD